MTTRRGDRETGRVCDLQFGVSRLYITPIETHTVILAVGNTKGSVGRTTIAVNLATLRTRQQGGTF
jgi:Mrp family chromosome partitioning ATPase